MKYILIFCIAVAGCGSKKYNVATEYYNIAHKAARESHRAFDAKEYRKADSLEKIFWEYNRKFDSVYCDTK